jgi:tRNA U54 and U55 pseudouridine synthase Pus10
MRIVDKEFFDQMKEIESQKAKRYAAVVWLSRDFTQADYDKLNALKNIKLA